MTVKADHRLVQPRPEHYTERIREDDEKEMVLVGPYNLKQRDAYFRAMSSLYLTRHQDAKPDKVRRAIFQKWRNLVFSTIGDEYVPVKDPKTAKNAVKIFDKKEDKA